MRKLVLIGLTVTAVFAIAAVAFAQYNVAPGVVTVTSTVTPSSGGTAKKPVNAGSNILFTVNPDSNSTLAGIDYVIPPSLKISGAGFPACSAATVNAKGESACPAKSKVGVGTSTALLGPGKTPITFTTGVYTNGANGLTLALKQDNGSVQVAFDGKITADNHITLSIPTNVQQPAPGLYSYVTSTRAVLGPATGSKTVKQKVKIKRKVTRRVHGKKVKKTITVTVTRKVKKKTFLVSRVGCNGGKDTVTVNLPLSSNPNPPAKSTISGTGSSACS